MHESLLDSLTRHAASRPFWQVAAITAMNGLWSLTGRAQAQAAPAAGCLALNQDATCPPDTDKRTKPGNVPTVNGCGPEGGDIKIPQGYGKADYTGSCNNHDVCYEECATPKATCDDNFLQDMYNSCAAAYPGVLNTLYRGGCYERAYIYYQAVSQFGGDAWVAAQQKACECCTVPVTIYCNCNKTCYTSTLECTLNCKASLGCFTGICAPATPEQCPQ